MKAVSIVFGTAVVGVIVCFVMSVYTAVQGKATKVEQPTQTQSIPLPAE